MGRKGIQKELLNPINLDGPDSMRVGIMITNIFIVLGIYGVLMVTNIDNPVCYACPGAYLAFVLLLQGKFWGNH